MNSQRKILKYLKLRENEMQLVKAFWVQLKWGGEGDL
jgi:hypothetical protein